MRPPKTIEIASIIEKNLFELLGLENLPQDKRSPLIADMVKVIQTRITSRIFDELDETGLKEFAESTAHTNPKKTKTFLESKNIDLDKITGEEVTNFKAELLTLLGHTVK